MTEIVIAQKEDIPAWLDLAREVEALFGPLVGELSFQRALQKNIERGTALCARETNGPPGAALLGGLLFSPKPPRYLIGWLAVARSHRRQGIGQMLVRHVLDLAETPAELVVTTFGADHPDGEPARRFYEQLGFHAAELAAPGPEGGSRQIFRFRRMNMIEPVNLAQKFDLFQETWSPKIVGELNDAYVKLAKLKGEFLWHQHKDEDELFLVVKGRLLIKLRQQDLWLDEGEFAIIPKGVEHCPIAENEVHVLLLEPKSTLNTGDVQNERTVESQWI